MPTYPGFTLSQRRLRSTAHATSPIQRFVHDFHWVAPFPLNSQGYSARQVFKSKRHTNNSRRRQTSFQTTSRPNLPFNSDPTGTAYFYVSRLWFIFSVHCPAAGRARLTSSVRAPMVPTLVLHALFSTAVIAMDNGIFLQSHNPISNRIAVFEDDEKTAFLYLLQKNSQKPEKDAVVYSRVPLPPKVDWSAISNSGNTPPLSIDVASKSAIISNPKTTEFSFKWSKDGNSVAILRNGIPLAFASTFEKYGFSKAIAKPSPLANPWNQNLYIKLFKQ